MKKREVLLYCVVFLLIFKSQLASAQKDILVVLAHPNMEQSQVNKSIFTQLKPIDGVTISNLYEKYPDFNIDVEAEQILLVEHGIIIFQFPLYWFSSPSLLKKWQDDVITSEFSIGDNNKLKGKEFMIVVSVGGTAEDYRHGGLMDVTMDEVLTPFETFSKLTEMKYLTPFITYAVPNPTILNIPMTEIERSKRKLLIESSVKELIALIKVLE